MGGWTGKVVSLRSQGPPCNFLIKKNINSALKISLMKKFILSILTACTLFLAGCLETTQEITIKDDGSGTVSTTQDMSALIGLAKQMGGATELEKAGDKSIDSSFSLKEGADSIPNLTPEERAMVRNANMRLNMNLKDEKFLTTVSFPFSKAGDIAAINKLTTKVMGEAMKSKMEDQMKDAPGGMMGNDMPEATSIEDYYKLEFSNGELTRKVDKSKYAGVESDEFLKGMRQAAGMGLTVKTTYIINLPRPATKAEGKNVKLSDDKKKVTVSASLDEFFDDPESLEFKIKY
jgi:hypothetical protein